MKRLFVAIVLVALMLLIAFVIHVIFNFLVSVFGSLVTIVIACLAMVLMTYTILTKETSF